MPVMAIDARLLEILACPEDKGPLLYFAADALLYNPRLKRKYRVEHDVPQMLIEESTQASDTEHQALLDQAKAQGVKPNF
jgi:uncharacterized protein YbaR (Trm112 family)